MTEQQSSFQVFRNHLKRAKSNLDLALKCKEVEAIGMGFLKESIIHMKNNLDILVSTADKVLKGGS